MTLGLNFYVLALLLIDEISHIGERCIFDFFLLFFSYGLFLYLGITQTS
jgi:hypothetical protein